MEYGKKFIIIGNKNAIKYKGIFKLIRNNEIWLGQSIHSGDREFRVPDYYPLEAAGSRVDENGVKYIRVKGVRWFTNLDFIERHENITLYKHFTPEEYPRYDNYDAIDISITAEIPCDYDGTMGVPITFLDKYNPDQFEILGVTQGRDEFGTKPTKWYINPRQINPDGTTANGGKVNTGAQILLDHIPEGVYYMADNADGPLKRVYDRILIRRKGVG